MRTGLCGVALALFFGSAVACVSPPAAAGSADVAKELQSIADQYVAERGSIEKISGVALHVDLNGHDPIDVFSGTYGEGNPRRLGPDTLFEIGSNTKHFTAALILMLEAKGVLNIDQTVGDWLPQYQDWAKVKIRSLLDMTSDIPNYSETISVSETMAANISHQFSMTDLVAAVYRKNLPVPTGWFYSNTNTILAGLIIEAATHMRYKDALKSMALEPLRLDNTFYDDGPYPPRVQDRLPSGIYDNSDCTLYQPKPCDKPASQPLIGRDVSHMNMSWAGPAGAIASDLRDLAAWIRALFGLRVIPRAQLDEMTSLVSMKTGKPIKDVSADDPEGFGLSLGRKYAPNNGSFWFYEGMTLGFRTIFTYWPQYDLVITASTNSQPATGQNQLGPFVIMKVLETLRHDKLIAAR